MSQDTIENTSMFASNPEDKHKASVAQDHKWLRYQDRLPVISQQIDKTFNNLVKKTNLYWGRYKGRPEYPLVAKLSQVALMKKIIFQSYPDRKEFFFLDIGAGEGQSIDHMSQELNADHKIPKDIRVHCMGVGAEINTEKELYEDGICICYKLGAIKIECLEQAFADKASAFENTEVQAFLKNLFNKCDLIVSSWTFIHCEDPLGLLLQAYAFLRPGSGLLFVDRMHFKLATQENKVVSLYVLWWLLLQHEVAFLFDQCKDTIAILKSGQETHLNLGLRYKAISENITKSALVASTTAIFEVLPTLNHQLSQRSYENFLEEMTNQTSVLIDGSTLFGHPRTIRLMADTLFPDYPAFLKRVATRAEEKQPELVSPGQPSFFPANSSETSEECLKRAKI